MQSQTLTIVVTSIGICGTLGGIIVGQFLARSWQREQWLRDKKNEEFRELLAALAESHRLQCTQYAGAVLAPEEQKAMVETQSRTTAIIRSRIFTAEIVREIGVEKKWNEAVHIHHQTLDVERLEKTFAGLSAEIVQAAMSRDRRVRPRRLTVRKTRPLATDHRS